MCSRSSISPAVFGLLLAILVFGLPRCGYADGGVFVMGSKAGQSADQRAILVYDEAARQETLVLTTQYTGDPADFAWIIPVPTLPASDQVATWPEGNSAFSSLFYTTEPRIIVSSGASGMGCIGCGGGAGAGGDALYPGVDVVDRITVDGLDISLLNAREVSSLSNWLNDNGYAEPTASSAVFQHYIDLHWGFVAVKVAVPSAAQGTISGYFPPNPLKMTFTAEKPVFPLCISSINSVAEGSEVLLYVMSAHRMQCANYPTVDMSMQGIDTSSEPAFQESYEEHFTTLLDQPDGRTFVTESASPLYVGNSGWMSELLPPGEFFLTRLRSIVLPAQMTNDVVLENAPDDSILILTSEYRRSVSTLGLQTLLALLLAFGLVWLHRRMTMTGIRQSLVGFSFLALLLLGMLWGM